jgi:hypothetical protein
LIRYDRVRTGGPGLDAIEVLNEQNRLPQDNGPMLHPGTVARLHTKLFRFARTVDHVGTKIITGGLHPAGSEKPRSPSWTSDFAYARLVLSSEAFLGYRKAYGNYPLDGFGYHPYPFEIRATGDSRGKSDAQVILCPYPLPVDDRPSHSAVAGPSLSSRSVTIPSDIFDLGLPLN